MLDATRPPFMHSFIHSCNVVRLQAHALGLNETDIDIINALYINLCILRCLQKGQEIKAPVKQNRALQK